MSNFADNFQTLCDRVITIMHMIKAETPYKKPPINQRGLTTTTKNADGRVFNFCEDIHEIRNIAERVELRLFKYVDCIEEIAHDVDLLANKLVTLRLEAPNAMMIHKEDPSIKQGEYDVPKGRKRTHRQPDFKKHDW
jgi:hypothetical protein